MSFKKLSDLKFNVQSQNGELPSRNDFILDPRTVFLFAASKIVYLWIGQMCHPSYRDLYILCAKTIHSNLVVYENDSKNLVIIFQNEEPASFWEVVNIKGQKPSYMIQGSETRRENQFSDVYKINKNWNNWFINFEEECKIRSARSQKSILVYAERAELENKSALFVYPFYLEPLFVLDLDDLSEDVFAILADKQEQKCFIWKGSLFEEVEDGNGNLNLQEFVHLAVESFFETEDLECIDYIFENSGEESDRFLNYFS